MYILISNTKIEIIKDKTENKMLKMLFYLYFRKYYKKNI